jgi:polysaccharide pyruvyl transferase WcaK-like protein
MKHFLLCGHGGAYNHGAEAIVKTTIALIREKYPDAHIALSSHFPEQDREFSIDADEFFASNAVAWAKEKSAPASKKAELAREMYADALGSITADTTLLSVGGDNYCYNNWHRLAVFQERAAQVGAKSILWSCSVEPSEITPEMVRVLNSHTHIISRESHTFTPCVTTRSLNAIPRSVSG